MDTKSSVNVLQREPEPPRPVVEKRREYEATCLVESFIVPVLKRYILSYLDAYAGEPNQGDLALDVGCGRQPFRRQIESLGYEYLSVDAEQNPEGLVDYISPIDAPLPVDLVHRSPFKLIVCTEVLEHVADWTHAFANFAALLGSGGRLLITCPHLYPPHEVPYDFWRPTQYALQHYARQAGFRCLAIEQAGDGWDVLGTLLAGMKVLQTTSFKGRIATRIASFFWRYLLKLALSPNVRKTTIKLHSSIYLANIAMFEKQ